MHFSNVDFVTWSKSDTAQWRYYSRWCIKRSGIDGLKLFEISINGQLSSQINVLNTSLNVCQYTWFFLPLWSTQFTFSYLFNHHLLLLKGAGQYEQLWNLTGLVDILPLVEMELKCHLSSSSSFFQTLLVLSSLSAIALVISLLVVLSFLIHYCCCHRGDRSEGSEEEEEDEDGSTGHGYNGKKGRGICCVTWVAVAAVTLCWWGGGFRRHYHLQNDQVFLATHTSRLLVEAEEVFRSLLKYKYLCTTVKIL